jgi:beta-N-acetylhexosaminidase
MSESKSMILGVAGPELTPEETAFFQAERPWGFILFGRNVVSTEQLCRLTDALRACLDDPAIPILIDQEGGRVQRLRPPLAPNYPPAIRIGELFDRDEKAGRRAAWLLGRLHALDLLRHGINVDCVPVLDVPAEGSHEVIGQRAYHREPETVALLASETVDGLMAGGLLPVMKHMPGHGRANADTHFDLPVVDTQLATLEAVDFLPFRRLNTLPMGMSAHVVFSAIDASAPATQSRTVIDELIRGAIGFEGLLMTDDLSMNALKGDLGQRAATALQAGCDIALHCNGRMDEMKLVAHAAHPLGGPAAERARRARAAFAPVQPDDEQAIRQEFEDLMSAVAVA